MNTIETVLITGASSGIGLELARQFAKHGHRLILTAPVKEELENIARDFSREYHVEVGIIPQDLTQPDAAENIFRNVQRDGAEIHILVNNAGFGQRGKFWEISLESDIAMIRVNIEATLRLTKLFLPEMLNRNAGRILNTASIAGFEPGPLLAVYHATKAFVLSLSESLATELEGTGITVTALCPGATDTDFFPKANMLESRAFQQNKVMAPQDVAALGYDALMRGDRVYVPGAMNKVLVSSRRVLTEHAQAKKNETFYKDVETTARKHHRGDYERKAFKRR
ncbi:MAG: short-chain dehydrogenase/reductase [Verrucomicrobiales bacterium]|nr:short-chain dehydrogenase/reductase [Verrucomicrobiales bacterium]